MRKLDLHIHTIPTISDSEFTFSLEKLQEYISSCHLDCIAITNHNQFEINQFRLIKENVNITVFPGIEINLENGHLLLISPDSLLDDFEMKCNQITALIKRVTDYITTNQLNAIFNDLNRYLLIPHYDKSPRIDESVLCRINTPIFVGEVNSPKKFVTCCKAPMGLTPVFFSDIRIAEQLREFPTRSTYVDIGDITLSAIKHALMDKGKVSLCQKNGTELFQVLNNGLEISTGLTIVLGERSTGKTYTLNKIADNHENVKYLKQFSLWESDEEADRKRFEEMLSIQQSSIADEYLSAFKTVVDDVQNIDLNLDDKALKRFLDTLIQHAKEQDKADVFSKAQLYREARYEEININGLKELIESVTRLIDNTEYRKLIDMFINIKALYNLNVELMTQYTKEYESNSKKRWVNDIIDTIKEKLKIRSSSISIADINFHNVLMNKVKMKKFALIVEAIKTERIIYEKTISRYTIQAKARLYRGVKELKGMVRRRDISMASAYEKYDDPYAFLNTLREIDIPVAEFYKYFVFIEYGVLNEYGYHVSGGERSEFNLLKEISDANKYDLLLLDEPESSFDNLFLRDSVNQIIRDILRYMPVVVVTHNNTVGASIKPDYLIYTRKETSNGRVDYQIYRGHPSDKELIDLEGRKIKNYNALLDCLEAGDNAYGERRRGYEILRD